VWLIAALFAAGCIASFLAGRFGPAIITLLVCCVLVSVARWLMADD
jgi:hypothetical protein